METSTNTFKFNVYFNYQKVLFSSKGCLKLNSISIIMFLILSFIFFYGYNDYSVYSQTTSDLSISNSSNYYLPNSSFNFDLESLLSNKSLFMMTENDSFAEFYDNLSFASGALDGLNVTNGNDDFFGLINNQNITLDETLSSAFDSSSLSSSWLSSLQKMTLENASSKYKTYQSPSTGYQYSIRYPSNWIVEDIGEDISTDDSNSNIDYDYNITRFTPQPPLSENTGITLTVMPLRSGPFIITLEAFLSEQIMAYKNDYYGNFTVNEFESSKIDNKTAYKVDYNLTTVRALEYYIQSGDNVYIFSYNMPYLAYDFYLPVAQKMVQSLQIHDDAPSKKMGILPGIAVANFPQGMGINPNTNQLYVANYGSNIVSVVDLNSHSVIKNITVKSKPHDIGIIPFDNSIYVANYGSNLVSVIDGTTNTVTDEIPVENSPMNIEVDPNENERIVFVSNRDSNSISAISGEFTRAMTHIPVGSFPLGMDINPVLNKLYVVNAGSNTLTIIDYFLKHRQYFEFTKTDIAVGDNPVDVVFDEKRNRLYVISLYSKDLTVIDATTLKVLEKIPVDDPSHIALDKEGNLLFITSENKNTLSILNLDRIGIEVEVEVEVDSKSQHVNNNKKEELEIKSIKLEDRPRYVLFFDGNSHLASLDGNSHASGYNGDKSQHNDTKGLVYVSNDILNKVYVIDPYSLSVLANVRFSINPEDADNMIQCNDKRFENNQNHLYPYNTTLSCNPVTSQGFVFNKWITSASTTTTATTATTATSLPSDSFLSSSFPSSSSSSSSALGLVGNATNTTLNQKERTSNVNNNNNNNNDNIKDFTITEFSTIGAIFEDNSLSRIVTEEVRTIIGAVIAAPFVGWLIPFLIERTERKKQSRYLKAYISLIDSILEKNTNKENKLELLDQKQKDIKELVKEGIIRENIYEILLNHITLCKISAKDNLKD